MKRKVGRPRGSGPAQLIRAVFANEFYLAVEELEKRGAAVRVTRRPAGCRPTGHPDKAKGVLAR